MGTLKLKALAAQAGLRTHMCRLPGPGTREVRLNRDLVEKSGLFERLEGGVKQLVAAQLVLPNVAQQALLKDSDQST